MNITSLKSAKTSLPLPPFQISTRTTNTNTNTNTNTETLLKKRRCISLFLLPSLAKTETVPLLQSINQR